MSAATCEAGVELCFRVCVTLRKTSAAETRRGLVHARSRWERPSIPGDGQARESVERKDWDVEVDCMLLGPNQLLHHGVHLRR